MPDIIKNGSVIADDWNVLRLAEGETPETVEVPAGKTVVPLPVWKAQRAKLEGRAELAVWIPSDGRPEDLKEDLNRFAFIAVDFPKFTDGRGYSIAFLLRDRLGYKGEIRAIGDVLKDQLFYMQRVGFDAFAVRADKDIHDAVKSLKDFTEPYQNSWDRKSPLFGRVKRTGLAA
jgi:uncharacterized protein (DUF934 family)